MDIVDILAPQGVFQRLKAANKKKLLLELAQRSAPLVGVKEDKIFETLWEREKLATTGVGHGVAIPHGRLPKIERITGIFARLEEAIDFESVDDAPVDLVFLLLTPEDAGADHLKALARVSRLMRGTAMCEKLRAAPDKSALYALLTEPTTTFQAA
jgi:PTS system nitrogen regulatory IIA component